MDANIQLLPEPSVQNSRLYTHPTAIKIQDFGKCDQFGKGVGGWGVPVVIIGRMKAVGELLMAVHVAFTRHACELSPITR